MGMKNSVPNPSWEIIYKRKLGKSWKKEVPLMPSPLVADPTDSTIPLGKMNIFQIHLLNIAGSLRNTYISIL